MKNCKGCMGVLYECYFIRYAEVFTCPCFMCIVKPICENVCEGFEEFMTRYAKGTDPNGDLI